MSYKSSITLKKVALPASIIAVVNILVPLLASQGIVIDETYLWDGLTGLYVLYIGARNWIKNRKKKAEQPVKAV